MIGAGESSFLHLEEPIEQGESLDSVVGKSRQTMHFSNPSMAASLNVGNGSERTQHPIALCEEDWPVASAAEPAETADH